MRNWKALGAIASLCVVAAMGSCGKADNSSANGHVNPYVEDAHADNSVTDTGSNPQDTGMQMDINIPTDSGPPPAATGAIPPECAAAAKKGLTWLVAQQTADGSWATGAGYPMAQTALAVLKLETHAIENGFSPYEPAYEYQKQVLAGTSWIFAHLTPSALSGALDTNNDGYGITFPGGTEAYEAALALMAIAGGKGTDRIVDTPGILLTGWSYQQVVQDMVDWFAYCQNPNGGWRYTCQFGSSDNSVTQYVTLALEYAEHPDYHFEATIPDTLRTALLAWVASIQDLGPGANHGASGYDVPGDYPNAYKTGALLQQLALLGLDKTNAQAQAAMDFLINYWPQSFATAKVCPAAVSWRGNPAEYMTMWAIMKGLIAQDFKDVGGVDWYADFCKVLIDQQLPDGSWPTMGCDEYVSAQGIFSTEWALLVLEKAAPPPPPTITPH